MSPLISQATIPHKSQVPDNVKSADVVNYLHDHGSIIRMNPFIFDHSETTPSEVTLSEWKLRAPDPNAGYKAYKCAEKVPGWGRVDFQCMFQDFETGYFCLVLAPMGTRLMETAWLDTDDTGHRRLKDSVSVRGNSIFFPFIKHSLRKARLGRHEKMMDAIRKSAAASV